MPHVYLHVPFCQRRCSYCDFSIAVRRHVPTEDYVAAVRGELALVRAGGEGGEAELAPAGGAPLETVYFGGGTPSLLRPDAVTALLGAVEEVFPANPAGSTDREVTLEANPEDVTPERAAAWRRAGINRVSLGAQSFDDRVLQWMHRVHDARQIGVAVRALRAAGIPEISLDLIFALPSGIERDWGRDLECAVALAPTHLSLYGLTVEPRTPLARWVSRGAAAPAADERYAEEYLAAHARLGAAGYRFYEVSNAAPDGHRSRHNWAYWTGGRYVGLGPAAHSFDGTRRRWNVAAWEAYRRRVSVGRSPVESEEQLGPLERELEGLYLGLRTERGVARAACPPELVSAWERAGWVRVVADRVVCSAEGWLRLDALVGALTARPRMG